MHILLWALVSLLALTCIAAVERSIRAQRRAALYQSRLWFEYSSMAAKNAEEWRGR